MVAVFVEECRSEGLGEEVGGVVLTGDGEEFEVTVVNLFADVVVAELDEAGAGGDDGVAGEFDGAVVVDENVGVPSVGAALLMWAVGRVRKVLYMN